MLVPITATGHWGSALRAQAKGQDPGQEGGVLHPGCVCVGQASASVRETALQQMWIKHLQAEGSASQMLMGVPVTDYPKQQIEREGEQ